jgi:hypothetical protein
MNWNAVKDLSSRTRSRIIRYHNHEEGKVSVARWWHRNSIVGSSSRLVLFQKSRAYEILSSCLATSSIFKHYFLNFELADARLAAVLFESHFPLTESSSHRFIVSSSQPAVMLGYSRTVRSLVIVAQLPGYCAQDHSRSYRSKPNLAPPGFYVIRSGQVGLPCHCTMVKQHLFPRPPSLPPHTGCVLHS